MSVKGFTFGSDTTIQKYDYDSLDNLPDLDTKASIDGTYPSLAVGSLLGNSVEDKVPYLFRPTGGDMSVGDREYDEIVGGSVVWNQLEQMNRTSNTVNGITYTNNRDGSFTISGTATQNDSFYPSNTATSSDAIIGHKYLAYSDIKNPSMSYICVGIYVNSTPKKVIGTSSTIYSADVSGKIQIGYRYAHGATIDSITVKGGLHDLTAMFGTTIADYIYSLEQSSAGAGVAFFRKLFPNDYYAYNAGELMSVSALQSHEMVGFNQWDEEWEVGAIDNTSGDPNPSNIELRCKNFIPALPNTQYCFTTPEWGVIYQYDKNKNLLLRTPLIGGSQSPLFTTLSNTAYLKFYLRSQYGTTYNHDICINISDPSRNGTYEPYVKHTYPLDSTLTLRGIPKLADGKLYYDGDVYAHDGTVTRRYGVVDLGTLDWALHRSYPNVFYTTGQVLERSMKAVSTNFITTKYPNAGTPYNSYDDVVNNAGSIMISNSTVRLSVKDTSYSDASAFRTAMNGVMLVYELATPTTETAEPYEQAQICDPNGTEQYVTDSIVPVGHATQYPENLATKIASLPALPTTAGEYKLKVTVISGKASYEWVTG